MNGRLFRIVLGLIAPNYAIDTDNYGQVIIYTHKKETDDGKYVEMTEADFEDKIEEVTYEGEA
jgi:hypothetical protein